MIRTNKKNNWGYLKTDFLSLPQELNKLKYNTALVGKWHLGLNYPNTPIDRGFKFFHGFLGDMMDDYWNHKRHGYNYMRLNEKIIEVPINYNGREIDEGKKIQFSDALKAFTALIKYKIKK